MTADEGEPREPTRDPLDPEEGEEVTDPAHRAALLIMVLTPVVLAALVYLALRWTAS